MLATVLGLACHHSKCFLCSLPKENNGIPSVVPPALDEHVISDFEPYQNNPISRVNPWQGPAPMATFTKSMLTNWLEILQTTLTFYL